MVEDYIYARLLDGIHDPQVILFHSVLEQLIKAKRNKKLKAMVLSSMSRRCTVDTV